MNFPYDYLVRAHQQDLLRAARNRRREHGVAHRQRPWRRAVVA